MERFIVAFGRTPRIGQRRCDPANGRTGQTDQMDRDKAIATVDREAARVLELAAASDNLASPVISCPGWDVDDLLKHLGNVYNWVGTIVEGRLQAPPSKSGTPRHPDATSSGEWMADRLIRLSKALREAPDDVLIWNFGPDSPSSVDFWCRRQLHETAIHRVDAELACGAPVSPLEPELAADAVSELLAIFRFTEVTAGGDAQQTTAGTGPLPATVHLHANDVDGAEWTIDTTARTVTTRHAKSDVAIRGTAWALARWCWGRPTSGEIEVFGDLEAAEAWRSTVVR